MTLFIILWTLVGYFIFHYILCPDAETWKKFGRHRFGIALLNGPFVWIHLLIFYLWLGYDMEQDT